MHALNRLLTNGFMMKYVAVFLVAFALGFMTYGLLHPVDNKRSHEIATLFEKFLKEEASKYADARSADEKLKAADEMYSKMMLLFLSQLDLKGPENKPAEIGITVQPEKKIYVEVPVPVQVPEKKEKKKLTIAEQLLQDKLTNKSFFALWQAPFIDAKDARVSKLMGAFAGKLKRSAASRTGLLENVIFEINQDPEKSMTKFEVEDVYDNRTLTFYEPTAQSFRSVPGDENLLIMTAGESQIIMFDLRTLPALQGNLIRSRKQVGDFKLRKTK